MIPKFKDYINENKGSYDVFLWTAINHKPMDKNFEYIEVDEFKDVEKSDCVNGNIIKKR